jgi:hypothetical protein
MAFFQSIMNATITLEGIFAYLLNLVTVTLQEPSVAWAIDSVKALLAPVWAYRFIACMVLALILAFFGKRIYGLLKFLAGFAGGFVVGTAVLAPMVSFIPENWRFAVGIVVGLVVALLVKVLYYVVVIVGVGYAAYFCAFSATYIPAVFNFTKGNALYSAIVAGVAIILVLLLLKWLEMLGTAALGGYGFALSLANVYNICTISFLSNMGDIPHFVVMGIVALVGFIIQVKTRKRY